MQSSNAHSFAPDVCDWLVNSRQPRILHLFDHACNLINEAGEVLSIVTPQIGNGPFNLVLADEICFHDSINLESYVSLSLTQLTLGNLIVHITNAKLWNPHPDWEKLHAHRDKIANQITQFLITNYINRSDLDRQGLPIPQSLRKASSLCSSLAIADLPSSHMAAQKLAGLGIGLTPSGDDFLMGAIYAAWIIHPFEIASILAKDIAEIAAPRTTSLSAAWLRSGGRGEAGILWHRLFEALISEDQTTIEDSTKNILAVGETSGADALAGFMGVFVSWMQKAGSSHA